MSHLDGNMCSDYINASYIDVSLGRKCGFIADDRFLNTLLLILFFPHRVLKRRTNSLQLKVNVPFSSVKYESHFFHEFFFNTISFALLSGPKHETLADFWRMIWEEKTATIVMLTNLKERKEVCLRVFSLCTNVTK